MMVTAAVFNGLVVHNPTVRISSETADRESRFKMCGLEAVMSMTRPNGRRPESSLAMGPSQLDTRPGPHTDTDSHQITRFPSPARLQSVQEQVLLSETAKL